MEENKPKKALDKFFYDPGSIEIAKFDINIDHLHWQLFCLQAQHLTTTPEFLLGSLLERYLVQTGYLDPKAPSTNPFKVAVTIKDLRTEPNTELNLRPNEVLPEPELEKPEEKPSKGKGLSSLFDDDDLDF